MRKLIFIFIIINFLLLSCLTTEKDVEVIEESDPFIIEEPIKEPPVEIIIEESAPKPEEFVVTKEEYDNTFDQVDELINSLNKIISSGNFMEWKSYLSESYLEKYDNNKFLDDLSKNSILKEYNIKLSSLRDYFKYVVIPSRSSVVIDEIEFIDEDNIKAFTLTKDAKFVVYRLIRTESGWIISE